MLVEQNTWQINKRFIKYRSHMTFFSRVACNEIRDPAQDINHYRPKKSHARLECVLRFAGFVVFPDLDIYIR